MPPVDDEGGDGNVGKPPHPCLAAAQQAVVHRALRNERPVIFALGQASRAGLVEPRAPPGRDAIAFDVEIDHRAAIGPVERTAIFGRTRILGIFLRQIFKLGFLIQVSNQLLGFGLGVVELGLEALDALGQRRLRDVEHPCRLAHRPPLGDGEERLDLGQQHSSILTGAIAGIERFH